MNDLILFNTVVVRIKRAITIVSLGLVGGAVKLDLLHLPHDWSDRLMAVAILVAVSTRPAAYLIDKDKTNDDKH